MKAVLACVLLLASRANAQPIVYVDDSAVGANNGTSWFHAYVYLQDALATVASGTEIRVAQGTYTPDRGGNQTPGDRDATFHLVNGVSLRGGYAGCAAVDPGVREIELYETTLSGDLSGDDRPEFSNNDENSYHVVDGSLANNSTILDGFTIAGGNANGPDPSLRGGGLFITAGSPAILRCTFRENTATLGGAISCDGASPTVTDSIFAGNVAALGGAIRSWDSSPDMQNCMFLGNSAEAGGANWFGASIPRLVNCTFFANSASQGNALAFDSCCPQQPSILSATNCIFWDEGEVFSNVDGSTLNISFSNVRSGRNGEGNISDDPLFVPGPNGCFYLSQLLAGEQITSPCVDAGRDSAVDLAMNVLTSRSDEGGDSETVDMGYHFSITGRALIMGDLDRNHHIDLLDIAGFQRCYTGAGPTDVQPCCRIFDFTLDADVDLDDVFEFHVSVDGPS